jgi:hypothetical protein
LLFRCCCDILGRVLPIIAAGPPYRMYLGDGYNLRTCECRKDWEEMPADAVGKCRCNTECPAFVDPAFLTAAAGQGLCQLKEETGYNCQAECVAGSQEVKWYASPCGNGRVACDPRVANPGAKAGVAPAAAAAAAASTPSPSSVPAASPLPKLGWDPREVIDLRGLQCELLEGKERCFFEDAQGRELCPEHVTSDWLAFPKDQYLCQPEMAEKYYCIAGCQEGNPEVRWGANEVAWCDDPKNKGACTPRTKREC